MKFTLSQLRRLTSSSGNTVLRFILTISDGEYSETHDGCLAGVDKNGAPWVYPPSHKQFHPTSWNKALRDKLLSGLERAGKLKGLGSPWEPTSEDTTILELK